MMPEIFVFFIEKWNQMQIHHPSLDSGWLKAMEDRLFFFLIILEVFHVLH